MPESLQGEKCDDTATKANQLLNTRNDLISYQTKRLDNLSDFEQLEQALMNFTSNKKDTVKYILKKVCEEAKCQVAAIFLISKDDVLERFAIQGKDVNGEPIDDTWLQEERYAKGESFTGSAANPSDGSYGKVTGELFQYENLKYRQEYSDKLGKLISAIALPLNGRNKTYGVLRIINKVDDQGNIDDLASFDPCTVAFLAGVASAKLSNIHRDSEINILNYLTYLADIIPVDSFDKYQERMYDEIFKYLVGNETPYKVAILYRKNLSSEVVEVLRFSEVSGVSNSCRVYLEEVGKEFAEKISSNTCQFIEGVHEEKNNNRFIQTDLKYFEDSKLEAFGVFSLFFEGKFIGAIALFFGYKFKLFDNNLSFLQSFSSLLAILVNKQTRAERLREFESLAEHWINETSHLSSTHEAIIHPNYQRIIGMGQDVIPFLLKNLKEPKSLPSRWFWALKAISGEDPVPKDSRGKSKEMIDAWLHWGIRKGYIKGDILMNTKSSI
ncbi:MAG: hypothetical protein PX638_10055 [Microcystis sp. M53599_WE4]|nr:hypothetical protein [Microcystis sp. M53599_WE4]